MDVHAFHGIFDNFPDPVLLKAEGEWFFNPPAEELSLSPVELEQLDAGAANASLWMAQRFYQVRAVDAGNGRLYLLRQDTFLDSASDNLCSQLRGILASAFGSTAQLGSSPSLRSDPGARDHLSNVNQAFYQILRMITQLDRCGTGRVAQCTMGAVDLAERLRALAADAQSLCAEAGVELTVDIAPSSLPMVGDGEQLAYAVLNLISNALPHLPGQGGRIALSLKKQAEQAVITVSDNGGGFSPDLLSDPLWNQPDRLPAGRGLGLGLALVRRIVGEHGGTVMAFPSSTGSRVVLSLPIREPDPSLYQSGGRLVEYYPGFSMAKILLSNALPRSLYFPSSDEE